ncbi:MAG: ATP-grasp domain-containing protein, partial [Candidatus Moraniibacteriota bacterium]
MVYTENMRIAVVYSLPSSRMLKTKFASADEDTGYIAKKVADGLGARGHVVEVYPVTEESIDEIRGIKTDCIFNLIEWCGLDISLSERAFEMMRATNIPVTGSSEELFVLTGDKIRMKKALKDADVTTPWGVGVKNVDEIPEFIPYPVIVKPHLEHCSIGLSSNVVVYNRAKLVEVVKRQVAEFEQDVLIEEFIAGRELLVYLIEEKGRAKILPIVEMLFEGGDPMSFQTYDAKWTEGSLDYKNTYYEQAKLTNAQQKALEENCLRAFNTLGFWGYARLDVRMRDAVP